MSRIGKLPIEIPKGVKVSVKDGIVSVEGSKGSLLQRVSTGVKIDVSDTKIVIGRLAEGRQERSSQGLLRSLLANMVKGVTEGFEKRLDITGVGYRAEVQGDNLLMSLGYSHPVKFPLPKGIKAEVDKQTSIMLKGSDRQLLGQVAADIRDLRPPEPYKGKGIRYSDEKILRKAGKAGKAGGKK